MLSATGRGGRGRLAPPEGGLRAVQQKEQSSPGFHSRVRTGLPNTEMTCAIPGSRMPKVVDRVAATAKVDETVARYAAEDSRRFR